MYYLDNSATTRVIESAAKKALNIMTENFGNPSSLHKMGILAREEIKIARENVAKLGGFKPERLFFTSCGTESINTAIFGAAEKLKNRGRHIITSQTEHSATLECMKKLENMGFDVSYLPPRRSGEVHIDDMKNSIREDTIFASIMAVNNETGAINDVLSMNKLLKEKRNNALFHVDAVQAFGKISLKEISENIDMVSVSGHKISAPKGIGALYIKDKISIPSLIYGGGQENTFRAGTEAVPLIAAFGVAALERLNSLDQNFEKILNLNKYLLQEIKHNFPKSIINGSKSIPYILNVSFEGIKSEVALRVLQDENVFVSSGSACAKGKKSHVLTAMKIKPTVIDSALRVSFCPENSRDDVDAFISAVKKCHKMFRI